MKKIAKILAILLSVCVLCGIAVISVNATTTTGAANEFLDASKLPGLTEGTKSLVTNKFARDMDTTGKLGAYQNLDYFASYSLVNGSNKYQRVIPLTEFTTPKDEKGGPRLCINNGSTLVSDLVFNKYEYTVFDFDIATQSFYFDENLTSISMGILPMPSVYKEFAYILRSGNNYYLSVDTSIDTNDQILKTCGVWSHVSIIFKTAETVSSSKAYIYFDGIYVGETTVDLSDSSWLRFFSFTFNGLAHSEREYAKYDFCLDNFALNFYGDGYDAANEGKDKTLTSYFSGTDYKTKSLTTLNDVIYNEEYVSGNHTASSIWDNFTVRLQLSDKAYNYDSLADLKTKISQMSVSELNGAVIYTKENINADELLPAGVQNLTIVCNGASVISENYTFVSRFNQDNGTTTYKSKEAVSNSDITVLKNLNCSAGREMDFTQVNGSEKFIDNAETYTTQKNAFGTNVYATIKRVTKPTAFLGNYSRPYISISKTTLSNIKYYVADFDVSGVSFNSDITSIQFGGYGNQYKFFAYLLGDEARENFYLSADTTLDAKDLPLSSKEGVWNHITFVVTSSTYYTFLDGELVGFVEGHGQTNFDRFSLQVAGTTDKNYTTADFEFSIDNLKIQSYGANYESTNYYGLDDYIGEIATTNKALYDCLDVVYTRDYVVSAATDDQYAASVTTSDGFVTGHFVVGDALSAITDGATITTRKNVNNFVVPASVDSFTVKCLDGATFSCLDTYTSSDNGDGTVTYTKKPAVINITWIDVNEDVIATSTGEIGKTITIAISGLSIKGTAVYQWNLGENGAFVDVDFSTATIPEDVTEITVKPKVVKVTWKGVEGKIEDFVEYWYVGSVIKEVDFSRFDSLDEEGVDGWYNIQYAKWDGFVENTEASQDMVYTPVKEPVATPKYKANITVLDKFCFNILLKKIGTDTISNITINGMTPSVKNIDGVEYYNTSSGYNVYYAFSAKYEPTIKYTVRYNDKDYKLNYTANINIRNYVESALSQYKDEKYTYERNLILNFLCYAKEQYDHGGTDYWDTWVNSILNAHEGYNNEYTKNEAGKVNHSNLSGLGLSFYIPNGQAGNVSVALYVPTDLMVKDVNMTLIGIAEDGEGVQKTGKKITIALDKFGDPVTQVIGNEEKECYVYINESLALSIYNMLEIFTINVTVVDADEKETKLSGTTNLAGYIEYLEGYVTENESALTASKKQYETLKSEIKTLTSDIEDLEAEIKKLGENGEGVAEKKVTLAEKKATLADKTAQQEEAFKGFTPLRDYDLVKVLYSFAKASYDYKTVGYVPTEQQ